MDNVILRYVFDRKKEADNDSKQGLLQIEVRERKAKNGIFISTGIKLYKNQFSDKMGFTCIKHNNALAITSKGRRIYSQVEAFVLSDKCKTIQDAKNYDEETTNTNEFLPFILSELSRKNIAWGTMQYHHTLIKRLRDFGKIVSFSDLTYENIVLFDTFLRSHDNGPVTLHKRHSVLHQYIKEAIKLGHIDKDPYLNFKMPSKKSKDPVFLEETEIQQIIDYIPEIERLVPIKDLFLFQMFTGLAYVDMQKFSKEDITILGEDKVIRLSRTKTDVSNISWFLPEAETIAEKYDYDLPKISNQKYNDYLKLLGAGAGIKKNLTTHVARHTYATFLLNKGVSLEVVSKSMGHSSTKMTQHYAKLLSQTIVNEMKEKLSSNNKDK